MQKKYLTFFTYKLIFMDRTIFFKIWNSVNLDGYELDFSDTIIRIYKIAELWK